MDLSKMTDRQLLEVYAQVMRELRDRGTTSSSNNPVADVAEMIASTAFGLRLERNSRRGFDGVDGQGHRYEVKGRRLTPENTSTQLSVVRNLGEAQFDFLVAIYFDEYFGIHEAIRLTHAGFSRHARHDRHQNGHRFTMKQKVRDDPESEDVTREIASAWM